MDLRWDWLRDRVAQNMFILPYIRSLLNPADFFTKALPAPSPSQQWTCPLFVSYPPSPSYLLPVGNLIVLPYYRNYLYSLLNLYLHDYPLPVLVGLGLG